MFWKNFLWEVFAIKCYVVFYFFVVVVVQSFTL